MALLVMAVLARLLTPVEFGSVAVITAVLAVGFVVQEGGLSGATIQRERVSPVALSTMFWINALVGLVMTLLAVGLAGPIAAFFRNPELAPLCQASGVTFLLKGLVIQHRAQLQRTMRFTTTARIDLGSMLIGGFAGIAMAFAGAGYWALVAQILITDTIALGLLAHAVRWPLRRPALTREVREMITFGSSMLGFNVLVTLAFNLQAALIGRVTGLAAAGHYSRAYALVAIPQTMLMRASSHVALPRLSRLQASSTEFALFYYRGVQALCLVVLPIGVCFAVFGDHVAVLVYGPKWGEVADLLRVFSIGLVVAPLLQSTGPIFVARGEPHRMLRWGVFGALVSIASTVLGLRWGAVGVAYGWSISTVVLLLPCLAYAYRGTEMSIVRLWGSVWGVYASAACTAALGWVVRHLLAGLPFELELVLGVGCVGAAYFALCYFVFGQKAAIHQLLEKLRTREMNPPAKEAD